MPFPYGVTVTLVHRVLDGLDEYGNDTYRDEPVSVSPAIVGPQGSSEDVTFADRVSTSMVFYLPYGTAVGPLDAIIYNGIQYEIQGDPQTWRSPFSGNTSPIEVRASVTKGVSA